MHKRVSKSPPPGILLIDKTREERSVERLHSPDIDDPKAFCSTQRRAG
jgi:hypothetical protein